jgi:hypothetical protein
MSHPLDGIWAYIDRAKESIDYLNTWIVEILRENPQPYRVSGEFEGNRREYVVKVFGELNVPLRVAVIAGEIIHHLRSSLDHLICALAINEGVAPEDTGRLQFPICSTPEKFEEAVKKGQINGISTNAYDFIKAIQPYNTNNGFEASKLYWLHHWDNADKHRLLIVFGAAVFMGLESSFRIINNSDKVNQIIGVKPQPPFFCEVSNDGEELVRFLFAEPHSDVEIEINIVPQIVFKEIVPLNSIGVIELLSTLLAMAHFTIKRLESEFA